MLQRRFSCTECATLAREFEAAWRADQDALRERLHRSAASAGVTADVFRSRWVQSVVRMSDDELDSLQCALRPGVAEVLRRWEQHAATDGHQGVGAGWRNLFIVHALIGGGYYSFVNGAR